MLYWIWIQCLFLKFLSFFLLAKFGSTVWNSPNRLYIWIYVITVLMFIFSKYLPFNFSGKFGFKILLKLSQKIATLGACQNSNSKWSKFVFWNSGTPITNTRIQSMYSSQTEVRLWRSDLQYTRHSFRLIMQSYINFQRNSVKVIEL